jgi:hypothetical protein
MMLAGPVATTVPAAESSSGVQQALLVSQNEHSKEASRKALLLCSQ